MDRRRAGALALTSLASLVVATTAVVTNYATVDVPEWFLEPTHVWPLLAALVVLSTVVTVAAARRETSSIPLSDTQREAACHLLASRVRDRWQRELHARLLFDPAPIPVHWSCADEPGDRPGEASDHPTEVRSDRVSDLAALFRRLGPRRLLLVGGAGTGKSTLAAQLLVELVRTRSPDEPVPVLLPVARWDVDIHPTLWDWISERLEEEHPALRAHGENIARDLVREHRILPILDGLDELPDSSLRDVVAAVARSPSDGLVLTCRSDAVDRLGFSQGWISEATVLRARPLGVHAVASYLHDCLRAPQVHRWEPVLTALRMGDAPVLAEVGTTALGAWLVRTVYLEPGDGPDPAALLDREAYPTAAALRSDLLDALVPALLDPRRVAIATGTAVRTATSGASAWRPEPAGRWLGRLAVDMEPVSDTDERRVLRWWRLPPLERTVVWRCALPLVGALVGLVLAAAVSFVENDVVANWAVAAGVRAAMSEYVDVPVLAALLLGGLALGAGRGIALAALPGRTRAVSWVLTAVGTITGGFLVGRPLSDVTVSAIRVLLDDSPAEPLGPALRVMLGSIVLACAVTGGILGARCVRDPERPPLHADVRLRGRLGLLARALLPGAALGVALSAMTLYGVLQLGPAESPWDSVLTVLVGLSPLPAVVAVYALAHGLPVWARTPSSTDGSVTPMSALAGDRTYALLRAASWLVVSVVLAVETTMNAVAWTTYALAIVGTVGGTVCVLASMAWPVYAVTVVQHALRRRLPLRLTPFLAEMNRLGVLGSLGAAYCFRHETLQEHLASSARTARPGA